MHTLFKGSKCSHESGHMYALIYNNILSYMLEPLPDHQEMAGHATEAAEKYCMDITCTCLAHNIAN